MTDEDVMKLDHLQATTHLKPSQLIRMALAALPQYIEAATVPVPEAATVPVPEAVVEE
jgi:hypothetical protein